MFPKKVRPFAVPAILLVLLFLSIILLSNFLIQQTSVQNYLIERLSDVTGLYIRTGKIELSLWKGVGIFAHGFEARLKRGTGNIVASRVRITLDAGQLLKRRIVPVGIYLFEPKIELAMEDEPGLIKQPPFFWIPGLRSISVENGQIHIKNRPFDMVDLYFDALQKRDDPLALILTSTGKIGFRGERITFSLRGSVFLPSGDERFPSADMVLETGKVPLKWISWPDSIPVKNGDFQARLKIRGNPEGPVSVNGRINVDSFSFTLLEQDREKDYSLPAIILEFESVIKREKISVSSLRLKTPDVSFTITLNLDLAEKGNPYLQLEAKSPFMALNTFKHLFHSPLLSPWVENRLFPLLHAGDVRLKVLSLKGRLDQFRNLGQPQNQNSLAARLECKNFEVFENSIQNPLKEISAEVILQRGTLLISGLKAISGRSSIKDASLNIKELFSENPSFEAFLDGSFDLHELMQQKDTDLIPPGLRHQLDKLESFSGNMECQVGLFYEYGWDFPRIMSGKFVIRDCSIKQRGLVFPIEIREAEIRIDEKYQNILWGMGSWGNSLFKIMGNFGIEGDKLDLQWANITVDMDMNEIIPLFYQAADLPLEFNRAIPCQVFVTKERGFWSCQGRVNLEDVALESENFTVDPPGSQNRVVFALDFRPCEWIELKKFQCEFGGSSFELSGFYDLKSKDIFTLIASIPMLSMEDLGVRFKKRVTLPQGILRGDLKVKASLRNPLTTTVTGQIEGEDLFFILSRLPSPVSECDFRLGFSGKKVSIDLWSMRIGESQVYLRGDLMGWDSLKGEVKVTSNSLNISDISGEGKTSLFSDKKSGMDKFIHNMDIRLKLDILQGQWQKLKWGPLRADLGFRESNLFIYSSNIQMDHGVLEVEGYIKRGEKRELQFLSHIQLNDQPIENLIENLGIKYEHLWGDLTMEAYLFMKGKESKDLVPSLSGSANILIKKGILKKPHVVIKVLDFMSLQKIFKKKPPDISEEGFYFESMGGHATIERGILKTENFVMKSPVFNAVASGNIDMALGTVDYNLGIQPLETIDILISKIPVLGHVLTGKEKKFLTYCFKVKGPMTNPEVKYVPFKNLGRRVVGAFKRLFLTPVRLFKDLTRAKKESPDNGVFSAQ